LVSKWTKALIAGFFAQQAFSALKEKRLALPAGF
jgi:hypothetical protein